MSVNCPIRLNTFSSAAFNSAIKFRSTFFPLIVALEVSLEHVHYSERENAFKPCPPVAYELSENILVVVFIPGAWSRNYCFRVSPNPMTTRQENCIRIYRLLREFWRTRPRHYRSNRSVSFVDYLEPLRKTYPP